MSRCTIYNPNDRTISKGDFIESFYCGEVFSQDDTGRGVDAIIPILLGLRTGEYTLQETYDRYVLYRAKGYL